MSGNGQLSLDFSESAMQRHKRAAKNVAEQAQPTLFSAWSPNIDVHLHSPLEAVATISGADPERAHHWLMGVVGSIRVIKARRVAFPVEKLDRLLWLRPPAQVTLDAATAAVAKALFAQSLGLRPLVVTRDGNRLLARSSRWPTGLGVKDVPWTAISALVQQGVELKVETSAQTLFERRLKESGASIGSASLGGSAVLIQTSRPEIVERLGLPGLAYDGEPSSGRYKMPLLASESLLTQQLIHVPDELAAAIRRATGPVKKLEPKDGFPWSLYGFQATDAGKGMRILQTTGGVLLAGDMGSGKAVRISDTVLTPAGRVEAGSIKAGEFLVGRDGKPTQVLGVYPQGLRPMFEVQFTDGYTAVVDEEHLWCVNTPLRKDRGRPWLVKSTAELIEAGLRDGQGNLRWQIPVCEPIQFEGVSHLPVDPYVLGVLLGDGSFGGAVTLTSADPFIVEEVNRLMPDGSFFSHRPRTDNHRRKESERSGRALHEIGDYSYVCADKGAFKRYLKPLGVLGKRAWEKRVPTNYLYAPEMDRRALLQGLLDTDGGLKNTKQLSSIEYTTTSEQLADDVVFLVQSLGGLARKSAPVRKTYTYQGEKKRGRPAWRITIALPPGAKPFRLPRKAEKYVDRIKYQPSRAIKQITAMEPAEAVCFKVAAEDELYLLDHAIVTHNTTVSLALVHELDLWPLLVVAPLSAFSTWDRQLSEMNRRTYLAMDTPAKSWEEIESGKYEAVVISFDRLAAFSELIERMHFKCAIADEIQRVRSPGSKRSRALRALASAIPFRIGLSGTPLVNGLSDLLPIGAFVAPGEWKPRASDKELSDVYPGEPTESVADHLGALMVRRRMEDVPSRLPKRNDHRVFVQLTREQRKALADLEEEAKAAKEAGAFDEPGSKIHAFARLQQMRKIVNNPSSAGVPGPNPKVKAAIDVASDFIAMGRKGVIFTADRESFREIGRELDALGIGWVGIWGSTPPADRIANEKKFKADPDCKVVVCTIQAGSESWSASPEGTWLITTSYVYAPATLDQMAARVYRMNSDPDGPDVEIMYVHAQAAGGSLDDRMLEILDVKRQMFAQVVDRKDFVDNTNVHYSMSDLLFLMTGERDDTRSKIEADEKRVVAEELRRKEHAKRSLYKNKGKNKDLVTDDGEWALTLEEWEEQGDSEPGADESESFDTLEDDE